MKYPVLFRLALAAVFVGPFSVPIPFAVAQTQAVAKAEFPGEIRLVSGAVLRKTSLIRWTAEGVVVKHAGGADPVRFATVAEPDRSRLLAAKAGVPVPADVSEKAQASAAKSGPRTVRGQVFVTTRGAGAYKFSGAQVVAYAGEHYKTAVEAKAFRVPESAMNVSGASHVEAWQKALESVPIVAQSQTDADGKFEINVPAGKSVFLFCVSTRTIAGDREINVWVRPVGGDETTANLDGTLAATYFQRSQRTR